MRLKNIEANSGLYSSLAGMNSRLDRFVILFDCLFCGNLVTIKDGLSPILSPKTASLNIANNNKYNQVQYTNSEHLSCYVYSVIVFAFNPRWFKLKFHKNAMKIFKKNEIVFEKEIEILIFENASSL